jgi:hypothetical protein
MLSAERGSPMQIRAAALVTLGLIALTSRAADPIYSFSGYVISNGSSVRSTSNCYEIDATVAEPVVGSSSSSTYSIDAGFRSVIATAGDDIFANSFEDCSP